MFLGIALTGLGRLDDAFAAYEVGLKVDPGNQQLLASLITLAQTEANKAFLSRQHESALKWLNNTLRHVPAMEAQSPLHENIGGLLDLLGRYDDAYTSYYKAYNTSTRQTMRTDTVNGLCRTRVRKINETRLAASNSLLSDRVDLVLDARKWCTTSFEIFPENSQAKVGVRRCIAQHALSS